MAIGSARCQEHRKLRLEQQGETHPRGPVSEANMRAIFAELDAHLSIDPEIGEYDQKKLRRIVRSRQPEPQGTKPAWAKPDVQLRPCVPRLPGIQPF